MTYDPDDTIAAIGTAAGGAPRGMVRLSGPQVLGCLSSCFHARDSNLLLADTREPSVIAGSIYVAEPNSGKLPCDLFLWPSDRSYTRQPTAELHTLGSPPLLEKLLGRICDCGARLAEPGEFTLRAFLAGRLDLTQAEAVLGVIDAHSSTDLDTALAQLAGGLSQPLTHLREQLLQLLAELEAGLDFAEEDIEFISPEQLRQQLTAAQQVVSAVAKQLSSRGEASDLPRVVLVGPPNAGKSSLFNAFVERFGKSGARALVSDQSGTTRDFVTAAIKLDGIDCELVDTAGVELNWAPDSIDGFAQQMTNQQQSQANLIVFCQDTTTAAAAPIVARDQIQLVAWTKSDLVTTLPPCAASHVACSSISSDGLEPLAKLIRKELSAAALETSRSLSNTATRCADSLRHAEVSLTQALQVVATGGGEELIAAEVRGALHALGQVVGAVYSDDILDRVFGQFCIGK